MPTSDLVEGLRERKDAGEIARIAAAAAIADAGARERAADARTQARPRPSWPSPLTPRCAAWGPRSLPSRRSWPQGRTPPSPTITLRLRKDRHRGAGCRRLRGEARRLLLRHDQDHPYGPRERPARRSWRGWPRSCSRLKTPGFAPCATVLAAAEVDRACREVVDAAGLSELFVHGTGHGVGLDIHEAPALGERSEDILCSGQVVTVEPGVYVPGLGGARTEDTVLVTGAGCEILTLSPKV